MNMCCRPKTSFLIDDILQNSTTKSSENVDTSWPARPTPIYLNQASTLHSSEIVRVPAVTSTTQSVYSSDVLNTEDILRLRDYSQYPRLGHPLTESFLGGSSYRGGFGRWAVLPGYSLAVLARHHSHNKRKGGQVRFSTEQTATLERRFNEHKYLSPEERRHLAAQLKLSDRQVKTWFQNRRAKWRRANMSTSTTDGNQSDDTMSSNTIIDEDVFDSPKQSPINIMS